MTHTDTTRALFRAVWDTPEDDAARLVYADALDDAAGHETERAELIRVQVELARTPTLESDYPLCAACDGDGLSDPPPNHRRCRSCDGTGKRDHKRYKHARGLLKRERELLAAHRREWARVPCPECKDAGGWEDAAAYSRCGYCKGTGDAMQREGCAPHWHRGFVYRVDVPALEWVCERVAATCDFCDGTGRERFADAAGDMDDRECPECHGTGTDSTGTEWRVPPWALAVAACHPVTEWHLTAPQATVIELPPPVFDAWRSGAEMPLALGAWVRDAVVKMWAKEGRS